MKALPRPRTWTALVMLAAVLGLASCGGDDNGDGGSAATAEDSGATSAGATGPPDAPPLNVQLQIRTHIKFIENPTTDVGARGRVLASSNADGSRFCRGGTFADRPGEPPLESVV